MTDQTAPPATPAAAPSDDLLARISQATGQTPTTAANRAASRYHENVSVTSLTDESVSSSEFDVYKGRKGFVDRISVLEPGKVVAGRVHYVPTPQGAKIGGYLICASKYATQGGKEVMTQMAPCCEKLEAARQRFVLLVLQYNTDPKGNPVAPFSYSLRVWRFNADIFVSLRDANKQFPLTQHDLLVSCTDEQYQKMTLQSCRESIVAMPEFRAKYGADIDGWVATTLPRLDKAVGRRLNAAEWQEVLGMANATAAVAASPAETPVESIAALLQVPGAAK